MEFSRWNALQPKKVTHPRFTCARLNRKNRSKHPALNSKGAASKALTHWLADVTANMANADGAIFLDKQVATCVAAYSRMLKAMDEAPLLLSEAEANRIYKLGQLHLETYSALRRKSSRVFGANALNKCMWVLLPKHHHLLHMLTDCVLEDRLNPRCQTLFCGESFIGHVGRMAKTCHRSSLPMRLLQRYKTLMGLKAQDLISEC